MIGSSDAPHIPPALQGNDEAIAWLDWGLRLSGDLHRPSLNPSRRHRRLLGALCERFDAESATLRVIAARLPMTDEDSMRGTVSAHSPILSGVYKLQHDTRSSPAHWNAQANAEAQAVFMTADQSLAPPGADAALDDARQQLQKSPATWSARDEKDRPVLRSLVTLSAGRLSLLELSRAGDRPAFSSFTERALGVIHQGVASLCDAVPLTGPSVVPGLSPRERETLEHLLAGASEKQVAKRLGRSPHTVHSYVKRIYRQLGVTSRAELLSFFLVDGERSLPTPKADADPADPASDDDVQDPQPAVE